MSTEMVFGAAGSVGAVVLAVAAFAAASKSGKAAIRGALRGAKSGAAKEVKKQFKAGQAAKDTAVKLAEAVRLDKASRAERAAQKIEKAKEANREFDKRLIDGVTAARGGATQAAAGKGTKAAAPDSAPAPATTATVGGGPTLTDRAVAATGRGVRAADRWQRGVGQKFTTAVRGTTADVATAASTRTGGKRVSGWLTAAAAKLAPVTTGPANGTAPTVTGGSGGAATDGAGGPAAAGNPVDITKRAATTTAPRTGPLFPPNIAESRASAPTDPSIRYGAAMSDIIIGPLPHAGLERVRQHIDSIGSLEIQNAGVLLNVLYSLGPLALIHANAVGRLGQTLATGRGVDRAVMTPYFAGGEQLALAFGPFMKAAFECRHGVYDDYYNSLFSQKPRVKDHDEFFGKDARAETAGSDPSRAAPAA